MSAPITAGVPVVWPVPVAPSWRPSQTGRFGAARVKDNRHHAATDLPAKVGDVVVAPAAGRITGITGWDGDGRGVYLKTPVGVWILAPLEPWVAVGDQVAVGDPLGAIVEYPGGDEMLHLELWGSGASKNKRPSWTLGQPRPLGALDAWRFLRYFAGQS